MSKSSPKLDLYKVGRTNLYHSDEERLLINEAICRTTEAIQRVREERQAIVLEETLQSDLERYLSARAPIKRLPDNVLSNIFEWCCQAASPVVIPFSSCSIPPQVTISHVCSAWRQIILDIPSCWCSIILESDSGTDFKKEGDRVESLVAHAWLSRAKSLPCSVKIMFTISDFLHLVYQRDWRKNTVKDLISLYRLKTLDLDFPDYHLRELLQLPHERLRYIEDLRLRDVDATSETALPFELHKLSSLTSVSLSHLWGLRLRWGVVYEDGSRFASIPWHQLRHIEINIAFPMSFWLRVLELNSVLETCSLQVSIVSPFMSTPPSYTKDPIHCSQLQEFEVDIYSPSDTDSVPGADDIIDPFLGSLRCPKLKSLTVGSFDQYLPPSINLQTFFRLQHVSVMHLEELIIYNTTHDLEVLPLLAGFPSLRRLVLPKTINFTEEAMCGLSSGSIAPFLDYLKITKPLPAQRLQRIFQMIKTRSSVGTQDSTQKNEPTPFKSVILYFEGSARKFDSLTDAVNEINGSGVNLDVIWERYD